MAIPPLLHSAQDRLHKQFDSSVDRLHKQNDTTQHMLEGQQKALPKRPSGERKALGLAKQPSGVRKALEQQNHTTEEGLKKGFQALEEQTKREGRLPTTAEIQAITGDTGAVPYINQLKPEERPPQYQGQEFCGPTVMGMIARARGLGENLGDGELLARFAQIGGTDGNGTTGHGMIAISESLGLQANHAAGADFNFINGELARGRPVVVQGNFYALPPHADPALDSGHYILLQGQDALGNYRVSDPQTDKVTVITADTLRNYIQSLATGGFAMSFS